MLKLLMLSDYPEYIVKLVDSIGIDTSEMGEDVWKIARQSEEIPNMSNIQIEWMFDKIESYIYVLIKDYNIDRDSITITKYVNNMSSYIDLNGEEIFCERGITKILEELQEEQQCS